MASPLSATRKSEIRLLQSVLPSCVASFAVHGIILAAMFMAVRGCEQGVPADTGGEEFRTIGLTDLPGDTVDQTDTRLPPVEKLVPRQDAYIEPVADIEIAVPDQAPSVNELLAPSHQSISETTAEVPELPGFSALLPGAEPPASLVPHANGRRQGGSPTPGEAQTSFMEITDSGQRFVYLIDTSGSMHNGGRMELAQSQLLASLRMLQAHQEFQVIFYGDTPTQMRLRGGAKDVYRATVTNLSLARDEIESVDSGGGTRHLPALIAAVSLRPDVVYFLTDGQDAGLSKEDLGSLLRQNPSGARIHVVEFARNDPDLRGPTWLHLLASETGGKYRRVEL